MGKSLSRAKIRALRNKFCLLYTSEGAEYPYARGRQKMSQSIDGVQTVYTYEAAAEYGAIHQVTETCLLYTSRCV